MQYQVREYVEDGYSPFGDWFAGLSSVTAARVDRYVRRLEQGNFGNSASVCGGVSELKIDTGPGYRVYYGKVGGKIIILLAGGSRRGQARDILKARARGDRFRAAKRKGED